MCGIVGYLGKNKTELKQMVDLLAHRGPDAKGFYSDSFIQLGHTRLSIQDLSNAANQPFRYGEYVLVYNGEIYNAPSIRDELEALGYKFKTSSDTEVVLLAYVAWKEKCLDKFNGMFAFCIYNMSDKTIFLARDRFGIKPLYFTRKNFAFASEIKALLVKHDAKIDPEGMKQFFQFRFTLAPKTLFEGIYKLPAGCYMTVSDSIRIKKWYTLAVEPCDDSYEVAKDKVTALVTKAVKRRMLSDVPVSSFLSGGLDSSIVATLAAKYSPSLNTFAIGFEDVDETIYAATVAEKIGSTHHEFHATDEELFKTIPAVIKQMDEPIGDPGFVPIYYLSRSVSRHNKVVLSGDGADEVFGGYDRYKLLHYGSFLRHGALIPHKNQIINLLKEMRDLDESERYMHVSGMFNSEEMKKLGLTAIDVHKHCETAHDVMTNAQFNDMQLVIPEDFLMKSDKMSSAFGVEQRVPFLDHEVVEYVFSLPSSYKLKLWNEKRILKNAFKQKLPPSIIKRAKHGFNVPIAEWFRGKLGDELLELLETEDLFDANYVRALLTELKENETGFKSEFVIAQKLWSVYIFEKWKKEYDIE